MDTTIITKRIVAIRTATPAVLEELFEMQNRICDLCGHPIQDLVLAALDHSIPVIKFARNLELSIEEAIRQANDHANLRAAHSECNNKKRDMARDKWFACGLDKLVQEFHILTQEEISERKVQLSENGRSGGRKTFENKIGIFALTTEQLSENGQKGGRIGGSIQGRIAAETGQIQALGRRAVESGQLARYASKGGRIQGPISGKRNAENGQLAGISAEAAHIRWHVNRGVKKSGCQFC